MLALVNRDMLAITKPVTGSVLGAAGTSVGRAPPTHLVSRKQICRGGDSLGMQGGFPELVRITGHCCWTSQGRGCHMFKDNKLGTKGFL